MYLKTTLLLFACSLVIFSCNKNTNSPRSPKSVKLSDEIKQWGYFKKGSYWIVRDSSNQSIDSIYVTESAISTYSFLTQDTAYLIEEATITFNKNTFYSNFTLSSFLYDHISTSDYFDSNIFDPDASHAANVKYGSTIIKNALLANYSVAGNTYNDVRAISAFFRYEGHSGNGNYSRSDWTYWKKGVGLLKRIYLPLDYTPPPSTRHCELIRYRVIQ